jgi:DNA mismatch repair protein MutL
LADQQWFFVNGRLIRDRLLQHAVRSAYQDVMVHGRHAVGVWRCELPPSMVDVNVHPTKAEVRFADPSAVRRVMIRAISDGLARIRQQTREPVFSVATLQEASSSQVAPLQLLNPLKEAVNAEFPRAMAESRAWLRPQRSESAVPWLASDRGRTGSEGGRGVPLAEVLPPPSLTQAEADFQTDAQPEIQTVLDTAWVSQPLGEARAQLRETYIVSESKEGLVLVDQHAAHERLVYEAMKEEMRLEGLPRQRLLLPELVTLQEREKDALCRHAGDLKKAGLVLESAEGNGVLVREMPSWLALDSLAGLLQDLAAEWLDEVEPMALEEAFEHMLETLACHRSIRAGRRLRLEEMDRLLRDMETTPNSGQCNHGRPTSILLSWEAIERLFGRR